MATSENNSASALPQLPNHISSNGQEIWDWAGKLSNVIGLLDKKRTLAADINRIGRECGSCRFWMTDKCPREITVNGRKKGPSMSASICSKFEMKAHSQELQMQWQAELDQVNATLEQKGGER